MTRLTSLSLIATPRGKFVAYRILIIYPLDTTYNVYKERGYFIRRQDREFIVENIPREFKVD